MQTLHCACMCVCLCACVYVHCDRCAHCAPIVSSVCICACVYIYIGGAPGLPPCCTTHMTPCAVSCTQGAAAYME